MINIQWSSCCCWGGGGGRGVVLCYYYCCCCCCCCCYGCCGVVVVMVKGDYISKYCLLHHFIILGLIYHQINCVYCYNKQQMIKHYNNFSYNYYVQAYLCCNCEVIDFCTIMSSVYRISIYISIAQSELFQPICFRPLCSWQFWISIVHGQYREQQWKMPSPGWLIHIKTTSALGEKGGHISPYHRQWKLI